MHANACVMPRPFPGLRSRFVRSVLLHFVQVMTDVIARGGEDIQLRATDVLLSSLQHDAALLRDFLEQQPEHRLMKLLVELLTRGKDGGVQEQVHLAYSWLKGHDGLYDGRSGLEHSTIQIFQTASNCLIFQLVRVC